MTSQPSFVRRVAPVAALLVLAPVIGEVLSGATRLSFIVVLVPEIMVWGCGALLAREAVRRWGGGWPSLMLMGMALAMAEEWIIQQTSLAPLPWLGSIPAYGRVWGVNWLYFLFMLGYETVWITLVPVQVAELLFPDRRRQPWLRRRGLVIAALVFCLGSFMAWFTWTQGARPNVFHVPAYTPPAAALVAGLVTIAGLVAAARGVRTAGVTSDAGRRAPAPWVLALAALAFGLPWYALMTLVFAPRMGLPLWIPVAAAVAWGALAMWVLGLLAGGHGWDERQAWALASGALLVNMSAGFLGSGTWPRSDVIAKAVFDGLAVIAMVALARRIWRASAAS